MQDFERKMLNRLGMKTPREDYAANREALAARQASAAKAQKRAARKQRILDPAPGMRTCRVCGETKHLEDFEKDKRRSHGRSTRCKSCCSAQVSAKGRFRGKLTRRTVWMPAGATLEIIGVKEGKMTVIQATDIKIVIKS